MDTASKPEILLGMTVVDTATGIEGVLVAVTHWYDRSDEAAIRRRGVNNDGEPWPIHWFPISRCYQIEDGS